MFSHYLILWTFDTHDNNFLMQVNTVFQLMLVAGALLQPEFGTEETQNYITYLG